MEGRRVRQRYYAAPRTLGTDFAKKTSTLRDGELTPTDRSVRIGALAVLSVAWVVVVTARLYSLQVSKFETWKEWAVKQHSTEVTLASERGPLFDRNNRLLALSVPAGSVYVRPRQIQDRTLVAEKLATILEVPVADIAPHLSSKKPFVWVERQIPRAKAEKVGELNLPGVGFVIESRRYYPYNHAGSFLLGKVGIDGVGLSGIERSYEKHLNGGAHTARVARDAFGNMIHRASSDNEPFELPRGNSLQLTIDADLQLIMEEELEKGRLHAKAKGATAMLIDADTGEILAMSQAPALNFNTLKVATTNALRNRVIESVFEPGSILKPIVAAAALEEGLVNPDELVNCEHGRFKYGKHVIKDVHPQDLITFHDVVVRSSNIGMTKVGERLGKDRLFEALSRFGFGQGAGLNLPGETAGILRSPSRWAKVDVATHSFGQGIAVTPPQIVRSFAALANGGKLVPLQIVRKPPPYEEAPRVISQATAQKVRRMLQGVVEDKEGTGTEAGIPGVIVGGKTGTAQKPNPKGRGYLPGAYIASFVGFTDAQTIGVTHRLVLMVSVDEPSQKVSIYGGAIAAPVFRRIMQRTLHTLTTRHEFSPAGATAGTYPGYG
jgi:cell division protein FtsI (penicillin-binding protein 3)